jgi:hypothetical protein
MKKLLVIVLPTFTFLTVIYVLFLPTPKIFPPEYLVSELPAKYGKAALRKSNSYLISDVSIIPMNHDTVLVHKQVLVVNGGIKQISDFPGRIDTSSNPYFIDGAGKYLIPGLNDMHIHLNDDNNLLLMIANGVTTARNMTGHPFHLALKKRIVDYEIIGPTLYTTSPVLEGPDKLWKQSISVNNTTSARDAVVKYKKEGYDLIKVYHTLPSDLYQEIIKTGDSIGISIVGHIPIQTGLSQILSLNQYSIEHIDLDHLRQISPDISLETKAEILGKSKKWICPTLIVHKNIQKHPGDPSIPVGYEQYVDRDTRKFWKQALKEGISEYELQKRLARKMHYFGGRFLSGTDCLNSYVLAGFSIHEELAELVSVGFTPFEALKTSTVHAAEFLKRKDIGTIEVGKIGDLVLITGNPLENIANTKGINGVMVKGKWFSASELDTILKDVKNAY